MAYEAVEAVTDEEVVAQEEAALAALPDDPAECVGEHTWTRWRIGSYFAREERFCMACGIMEMQTIEGLR
jgi:hypothetical protein